MRLQPCAQYYPMTVRRLYPICCLHFLADSACAEKRELGVDVFSDDTMPARFTVAMTGTLVLGLRSQNFSMRPDKSLVLITPGSLVVQEGRSEERRVGKECRSRW